MNAKHLQYQGRDSGEYPPRYEEIGYYDVEQSLERRYQHHQKQLAWQHQIAALESWLVDLERKLFHLPVHAHPRLAHAHRPHHR